MSTAAVKKPATKKVVKKTKSNGLKKGSVEAILKATRELQKKNIDLSFINP